MLGAHRRPMKLVSLGGNEVGFFSTVPNSCPTPKLANGAGGGGLFGLWIIFFDSLMTSKF